MLGPRLGQGRADPRRQFRTAFGVRVEFQEGGRACGARQRVAAEGRGVPGRILDQWPVQLGGRDHRRQRQHSPAECLAEQDGIRLPAVGQGQGELAAAQQPGLDLVTDHICPGAVGVLGPAAGVGEGADAALTLDRFEDQRGHVAVGAGAGDRRGIVAVQVRHVVEQRFQPGAVGGRGGEGQRAEGLAVEGPFGGEYPEAA